jgi:hypothetical protein
MHPPAGNKTFRKSSPESPNPRQVLVAANGRLWRSLLNSLAAAGFRPEQVNSFEQVSAAMKVRQSDLLFLNLGQPAEDVENCENVRATRPKILPKRQCAGQAILSWTSINASSGASTGRVHLSRLEFY